MFRIMTLLLFVLSPFVPLAQADPTAGEEFALRRDDRVVFLGDSITYAGGSVAYIEMALRTRFPDREFDLLNVGLPSETISGLSEPIHDPPRPDVHERLKRVLDQLRPSVVVICYGMNDGIYHPPSEEWLKAFQEGYERALKLFEERRIRVAVVTPAPFDPNPVRQKLHPVSAKDFSYINPYEQYDQVLSGYSEWILMQREEPRIKWLVNSRRPMIEFVAERRKRIPEFSLSPDGIHPTPLGHVLIGQAVLEVWNFPKLLESPIIDLENNQGTQGVRQVTRRGETVRATWISKRSIPLEPGFDLDKMESAQLVESWNLRKLKILNAKRDQQISIDGIEVGTFTKQELAEGITLPGLSEEQKEQALILELTQKKHQILRDAWLTEIGHKRPNTAVGIPISEARTKVDEIETQLKKLLTPIERTIEIRAVE